MKNKPSFLGLRGALHCFIFVLFIELAGGGGGALAVDAGQKIKAPTLPSETMQCRAGDVEEWIRFGKTSVAGAPKRNISCYIGHSDLKEWEKGNGVIVDVRSGGDFERYHPSGALNLTARDIKTKGYLASRPILMVGAGKGEQYLEEVCGDLLTKGFKRVKILDGGIIAWIRSRPDVGGLSGELQLASELNAVDLYVEQKTKESLFIIVKGASFDENQFKPYSISITPEANLRDMVLAIRNASSRSKGTVRRTIILGANRFGPGVMGELLQEMSGDKPIFYFRGSHQDYDREIKRELAMWSKEEQGPAPHRCGNR